MRIAFASMDNSRLDQHFGNARYWQIYELNENSTFIETRKLPVIYEGHYEGKFEQLLTLLSDCDVLLVNQIGVSAAEFMLRHNIRVFEASGEISAIIAELLRSNLLNNKQPEK